MKKLINTSFFYAILAMIFGIFYREYTKFNSFYNYTNLSVIHTHLFILGMFFFLIILGINDKFKITEHKLFKSFYIVYNIGVIITVVMLFVRGIIQVNQIEILKGLDASISGIAGIGHIFTGAGIILFFIMLKSILKNK